MQVLVLFWQLCLQTFLRFNPIFFHETLYGILNALLWKITRIAKTVSNEIVQEKNVLNLFSQKCLAILPNLVIKSADSISIFSTSSAVKVAFRAAGIEHKMTLDSNFKLSAADLQETRILSP